MNRIVCLMILTLAALPASAQTAGALSREFTLSVQPNHMEISKGESKSIEITILRGPGYRKGHATMGTSSHLPQGMSISFNPQNGPIGKSDVMVSVSEATRPGVYQLIFNATINRKTKGIVFKLIVK